MGMTDRIPLLYGELAEWWPLLSAPEDYAEEAAFYRRAICAACAVPPRTLLELGSGGGNNASHLKGHFQMTLVDRSPDMLRVSQKLNPECDHIQGDMRAVRLGRQFDAVFLHDAVMYLLSEADLVRAMETAFVHCHPGGVALLAPDCTRETFKPSTDHGGHDGGARSLRYLEWTWDPDITDSTYVSYMVYVLREGARVVRCVPDEHIFGLFGHADWLRMLTEVGFEAWSVPFAHSEIEGDPLPVFLGRKPGGGGL
jgi:SAM-dependent methyltransferase